jgi:hypothetical protein
LTGQDGKDGINSTLGAYFINSGVGTFPIYGSMKRFSDYGLELFIKSENDSFMIMPFFSLIIYSEINNSGRNLTMTNSNINGIEFFKINSSFRTKSCSLFKYNFNTQQYETVNTINYLNPEKTWN